MIIETVQDMFITPLHQQHASHTLASRVHGPQPHIRSYSATGPYIHTDLAVRVGESHTVPHRDGFRQILRHILELIIDGAPGDIRSDR